MRTNVTGRFNVSPKRICADVGGEAATVSMRKRERDTGSISLQFADMPGNVLPRLVRRGSWFDNSSKRAADISSQFS